MIFTLSAFGQKSAVDKVFDKYSGKDGYTTVYISSYMFNLLSSLESDDPDYNEFKKEHSKSSAKILREILFIHHIRKAIIDKVTDLVILHEFGGNPEADILKNADSISFFDVSLPFYFQRNSEKETAFRMMWGYKRLSNYAKSIVRNFSYDNTKLEKLFRRVVLGSK